MRLFISNTEDCTLTDTDILVAHNAQSKAIICTYKYICDIGEFDVIYEIFKAAADVHDIVMLAPQCDQSLAVTTDLQSIYKTFKRAINKSSYDDVRAEYVYFIKHDTKLSKQIVHAMFLKVQENEDCVQVLETYLLNKYESLISKMHIQYNARLRYGKPFVSGRDTPSVFVRHDYLCDFNYCIKHMVQENTHLEDIKLLTQRNTIYDKKAMQHLSGIYNMFHIYRRCVNINLLPDAPYGTVSMHVYMLCTDKWKKEYSEQDLRQRMALFVTYAAPQAYFELEQDYSRDVAAVSVADLESLAQHKRQLFYNYAIYMHNDISAAVYMRFNDTKIADVLYLRLNTLYTELSKRSTVSTDSKDKHHSVEQEDIHESLRNVELHVFFHRGVVNMRFQDESLYISEYACNFLIELIDIYRNAHWLGVNIFYEDTPVVFPRVMARLGGYTELRFSMRSCIRIQDVINYLNVFIHKIQDSYKYNKQELVLAEMYRKSIHNAMQNQLFMARENLRLTFSMTHNSVHQYFNMVQYYKDTFVKDKLTLDTLCRYVMTAILYSGNSECERCQHAYRVLSYKFQYDDAHDSDLLLLQADMNKVAEDLSVMSKAYTPAKTHIISLDNVPSEHDELSIQQLVGEHIQSELSRRQNEIMPQLIDVSKQQFNTVIEHTQPLVIHECLRVYPNTRLHSQLRIPQLLSEPCKSFRVYALLHVYALSAGCLLSHAHVSNIKSAVIFCAVCNMIMVQTHNETRCKKCNSIIQYSPYNTARAEAKYVSNGSDTEHDYEQDTGVTLKRKRLQHTQTSQVQYTLPISPGTLCDVNAYETVQYVQSEQVAQVYTVQQVQQQRLQVSQIDCVLQTEQQLGASTSTVCDL